jgi:hypothetical protein
VRGLIWAREIRFFTVAAILALLYALGKYTPAFAVMYELMPGVSFFTAAGRCHLHLLCTAGIDRRISGHRACPARCSRPARWQRALEIAIWAALVVLAVWLAVSVGMMHEAFLPIVWGVALVAAAAGALRIVQRVASHDALSAAILLAAFSVIDLAWNNAPTNRPDCRRPSSPTFTATPPTRPWRCSRRS